MIKTPPPNNAPKTPAPLPYSEEAAPKPIAENNNIIGTKTISII